MCGIAGYSLSSGAMSIGRSQLRPSWRASPSAVPTQSAMRIATAATSTSTSSAPAQASSSTASRLPQHASKVLVHVRDYTKGHPMIEANNHPVRHGSVVRVHNGIIVNDEEILADHGFERAAPRMTVDSEAIFALAELTESRRRRSRSCVDRWPPPGSTNAATASCTVPAASAAPCWVGESKHETFSASYRARSRSGRAHTALRCGRRSSTQGTLSSRTTDAPKREKRSKRQRAPGALLPAVRARPRGVPPQASRFPAPRRGQGGVAKDARCAGTRPAASPRRRATFRTFCTRRRRGPCAALRPTALDAPWEGCRVLPAPAEGRPSPASFCGSSIPSDLSLAARLRAGVGADLGDERQDDDRGDGGRDPRRACGSRTTAPGRTRLGGRLRAPRGRRRGARALRGGRGRSARGRRPRLPRASASSTSSATSSTGTESSKSSQSAGARPSRLPIRCDAHGQRRRPAARRLAPSATRVVFGLDDPAGPPGLQHAADSKYCIRCGTPYVFAAAYVGPSRRLPLPELRPRAPALDVVGRDVELPGSRRVVRPRTPARHAARPRSPPGPLQRLQRARGRGARRCARRRRRRDLVGPRALQPGVRALRADRAGRRRLLCS